MPTEIDILKSTQVCVNHVPVIVLGSGASLQYGVGGMWDLAAHLINNVVPTEGEATAWSEFRAALDESQDLERALHATRMPDTLERKIVENTRTLVIQGDQALFNKCITGEVELAHTRLIRYLLRTAHKRICIVTTNYDRLAEYAADAAGYQQATGFAGMYRRSFDQSTLVPEGGSTKRVVEVLKVHGSLDWFVDNRGDAFSLPDHVSIPANSAPLLVTPGAGKYLTTHMDPFRTIIGRADEAFVNARAVLCVGYGFKDMHIQPRLRKRAVQDGIPVVMLAKVLTEEAKEFLRECMRPNVVGIEEEDIGARVYTLEAPEGMHIENPVWEFGEFLRWSVGA